MRAFRVSLMMRASRISLMMRAFRPTPELRATRLVQNGLERARRLALASLAGGRRALERPACAAHGEANGPRAREAARRGQWRGGWARDFISRPARQTRAKGSLEKMA
jgi:hypothetical protein